MLKQRCHSPGKLFHILLMATLLKEIKGAEYVERGEWPLVRVSTRKARQLENLKVKLYFSMDF